MKLSSLKDQAQQMLPEIDKNTLLEIVREPLRQRNRTGDTLNAIALVVAGIAVGLTAGLLLAPKPGRKMRKEIEGQSRRIKRNAVKSARSVAQSAN